MKHCVVALATDVFCTHLAQRKRVVRRYMPFFRRCTLISPPERGTWPSGDMAYFSGTRGTIVPSDNFNSERAAAKLQRAMKGIGTEERVIIEVLVSYSNVQRQEIKAKYRSMFGKNLEDDLTSELGGHFEDACLALLVPHAEYLADCVYEAAKGTGADPIFVIDILCLYSKVELQEVQECFRRKYDEEMDAFLVSEASDQDVAKLRRVLWSSHLRDIHGGGEVSEKVAEKDANDLVQVGLSASWEGEDALLPRLLSSRNHMQLKAAFVKFAQLKGTPFADAVRQDFAGDLQRSLLALVECVEDQWGYLAQRLYHCIRGPEANDDLLIRILVIRSEIDLNEIKSSYKARFGCRLSDDIESEVTGDFRKLLLKMVAS